MCYIFREYETETYIKLREGIVDFFEKRRTLFLVTKHFRIIFKYFLLKYEVSDIGGTYILQLLIESIYL